MSDMYVAIYPYSNTNPTNKYRVAKSVDWRDFIDGGTTQYKFTEFDSMDAACAERDKLNAKEAKKLENVE